jgi:FkbM family methyltransferase
MRGWLSRRRFDLVEIALVVAVGCLAGFVFGRWRSTEADEAYLRRTYGPSKYSHNVEEWVVRDFFRDRRNGVFVDVGAADARRGSNTYYLESALGWSGIAVDALEEYRASYTAHRPKTPFVVAFVGEEAGGSATMYVDADRTESSSFSQRFAAFYATSTLTTRQVPKARLTDLLDKAGVTRIDFMSMDIELAEPQALAGFDIERFRPALVCVEAHPPVRQALIDYFARHRYVMVGAYLLADPTNFYFKPLDAAP